MTTLELRSAIENDKFTQYVYDKYDIQEHEQVVTNVPMFDCETLNSFDWNIGVIVGRSGSGKSTILKHLAETMPNIDVNSSFDATKPVVSQFGNMDESEVCELLYGMGLSSVPTWLHTPNQLSNGEKARFLMAKEIDKALRGNIAVIDEFTSVVNRDVAKSMSFALQRYVRGHNCKVIIACCHYDIFEWLQPDWIFNLNKDQGVEIEHINYKGDSQYNAYSQVEFKDILTNERIVC